MNLGGGKITQNVLLYNYLEKLSFLFYSKFISSILDTLNSFSTYVSHFDIVSWNLFVPTKDFSKFTSQNLVNVFKFEYT